MTKRIRISEDNLDQIFSTKGLLFDTNVWLRVDGIFTDSSDKRSRTYSWLYKQALERDHPLFLAQIVATEYVNVSLNAMAKDGGWKPGAGTKIHQMKNYPDWLSQVSDSIFHVSKSASRLDDSFGSLDFDQCFASCRQSSVDFNDVIIANICKAHELTLVTDDADLVGQPVDLITANERLL